MVSAYNYRQPSTNELIWLWHLHYGHWNTLVTREHYWQELIHPKWPLLLQCETTHDLPSLRARAWLGVKWAHHQLAHWCQYHLPHPHANYQPQHITTQMCLSLATTMTPTTRHLPVATNSPRRSPRKHRPCPVQWLHILWPQIASREPQIKQTATTSHIYHPSPPVSKRSAKSLAKSFCKLKGPPLCFYLKFSRKRKMYPISHKCLKC